MSDNPHDDEPRTAEQMGLRTGSPSAPGATAMAENIDADQLRLVFKALGDGAQVDLGRYRDTTVRRQVVRRMLALGETSIDAYIAHVSRSPEEARRLQESVFVAVTSFFRDPGVFEQLKRWLERRAMELEPGAALRVWVPGCASGEEAYSIAMLLHEVLGPRLKELDVHVFATDADERATRFARAGTYTREAARSLSEEDVQRYFTVEREQLRVAKHVRDLCVFATHDLLRQPPFRSIDVVSCRNVLIYFQREYRQEVLNKLHYALNPGGCLLLGQAESLGVQSGLFECIDAQHKLYLRRPGPSPRLTSALSHKLALEPMAAARGLGEDDPPALDERVKSALESAYMPASVLVDERGTILHLHGDTQRYLQLPRGKGDFSIGALCAPALRGEIKTLLHLLATHGEAQLSSQPVAVGEQSVRVVGRKLSAANGTGQLGYLLSFEAKEMVALAEASSDGPPDARLAAEVLDLRQELSATREHLHSLVEQLEAANDRMLSANQELQASSEEVQSANEELQASNEELLSLNEELQLKSQDLVRANDTLSSIQNSIQVALVVVDAEAHVISFNALAVRIFGLMPRDHGRSLASVPCSLRLPDLEGLVRSVVSSGESSVHRIDDDGRHYLLQVSPHENAHRLRTGAVLAFTDVAELRRMEEESQRLFEHFRATFEQATTGIAHVSLDGAWLRVNRHWCDILGYTEAELTSKSVLDVTHPDDVASSRAEFAQAEPALHREFEKRFVHKAGHSVWAKVAYTTVRGAGSMVAYRVCIIQDVTAARAAEQRLRESERELRQVSASLPLLPLSAAPDGSFVFVGDQWGEYLGVTPAEVLAAGCFSFVHPNEQRFVAERWARTVAAQRGTEIPLRLRRHDGEYRWFSLHIRPLVDEQGSVVRWFAAAADVHEAVSLRERLESTLQALSVTLAGARVASWTIERHLDGAPTTETQHENPEVWQLLSTPAGLVTSSERMAASVHPEDLARVREAVWAAIGKMEAYDETFRSHPERGPQRWFLTRGVPMIDDDGVCRRYRGVLVDITAQKELERRHADTLSRLLRANQLAGVGHYEYDMLRGTARYDAVSRAMLDVGEGELPIATVRAQIEPESQAASAARMAAMVAARASSYDDTICIVVAGTRRYIHVQHALEYDAAGRPIKMLGACHDVTNEHEARREGEQRRDALERLVELRTRDLGQKERQLQAILNGVPCAIGYWDADQRSRFANDAHRDWFGTSPEAMERRPIGELWRGGFAQGLEHHVAAVLAGERASYELEVPASPGVSGEARFAHVYLVPDGAPGAVAGFFSLVFDVTTLKRAQQQADAARRAKGQFLANMSHEIRTPLTAVLGLAELGKRAAPTRDTEECFGNIERAGRHLLAVITDILDFSRIEAGKLDILLSAVDLGELLAQVVTTVGRAARDKGLALVLSEAPDLPRVVRTDSARVAQVLINLLSNAVKFTDSGSVSTALSYAAGQLTIRITDTGVGISEDIQRRLFQPFEQGVPRGGNRVGGTGLGLAICKRIVAHLDGQLEIVSRPGAGTSVQVVLPCEAVAASDFATLAQVLLYGPPSPELASLGAALTVRGCKVITSEATPPPLADARAVLSGDGALSRLATPALQGWLEQGGAVVALSDDCDARAAAELPSWLSARVIYQQLPVTPLMLLVALDRLGARAAAGGEVVPMPLAGVRVLAAEDQEMNRLLLREMLAAVGASLVCVENGRRAVEQLMADGGHAYDVVLCDIEMPELDGYEATLAMRAFAPRLPIIGLTAHAFELARERGRSVGMSDYLTKPYSLKGLTDVIARHLSERAPS